MPHQTGTSCSDHSLPGTATAVIPARFASTRFPGKPLANETGKTLIQHVYERVQQAATVCRVIVATDDERIHQAVEAFGGIAAMTREDHPSGTDRVAEVAASDDSDIIVNVQGDEPEIDPDIIDRLVRRLASDTGSEMATAACPFDVVPDTSPDDPNAVKVVLDKMGRALYFSRSRIPHPRDESDTRGTGGCPALLHLGIYAYRRDFLLNLAELDPTPLETIEKLEQLRVLEHGCAIAVETTDHATVGIDTPEDYAAFVKRQAAGVCNRTT